MSNLLHAQERIFELLGVFAYQAKAFSTAGRTDFNKVSEDVLVPLFKLIFDLPDLKNLNSVKNNYPAIDLADDVARVAFQITATSESRKIKETLETFVEKELYKKYPRLIVYIITEKKDSYPAKAFADIIDGKFEFVPERDILDSRNLIRLCGSFQMDRASKIRRILEANFGLSDYSVFSETQTERHEPVSLNTIEMFFPKNLYVAELAIDREEIVKNSHGALSMDDPTRAIIRHYIIEQLKTDFCSGWHLYKNQLLTFHDLHEENSMFAHLIDRGTVDPIAPASFFTDGRKVDPARENVFKTLLRKTLQEQLYGQQVEWQHEENLFIFSENGNEQKAYKTVNRKTKEGIVPEEQVIYRRHESWIGEKESSRAVLEIYMKSENPEDVWYFKHRAFEAKIKHIDDRWFLLILPGWFFSYDGYHKSLYHADDLKWLKRKANTEIVFNDFRFIHYFLEKKGNNLLRASRDRRFLKFGDFVTFDNAPFLYDEAWNPPEEKKKKKTAAADSENETDQNPPSQANLFDL